MVDVLVVVDGATDETAEIAREHGVYTCVAARNRGQGAALRLGYRLAADCGARYVVTTDADGQYDGAELDTLVRPLVEDRADFVTGSRRLGRHEADSRVRWIGVRVFAMLASLLTWRRITDTSFGFRAMRADLACSVPLVEPQYQSSELLLGMAARGARDTRGADDDAPPPQRRQQEGRRPDLRRALRARHGADVVSGVRAARSTKMNRSKSTNFSTNIVP